ncbi:putative PDZ/DHR/GLGF domain protein [Candidatus Terasakiella magnetica]|uniref:Putative PDZ/DHR/GLGF domain protein n=1 Tax=Candidatus Terasakiella magnetica TaxID=1867952 RepID=A0A1C3RKC0_9PROT|nr:PDZ domain-containing protein [Candidatus Terasakiella magnetica]SCA57693.1 putative PDZ/DHR/GLGF domain protein [Candidatus Terasakiella magnetica]
MMRVLIAFSLLFSLSACVNNIEKYYQANSTAPNSSQIIAHSGPAEITQISSASAYEKTYSLMEEGYLYLGNSAFEGKGATEAHLQAVAQQVGAAKVLFIKKYIGTEDHSFAMTVPETQTTYHSGSFDTVSNPYSVNYSGTSTTYGTSTTWIPNMVKTYDQEALFFVKRRPGGFGAQVRNLTIEQRKKTNSNMGVSLAVVFKDSSAFYANLMRDDILISINETRIKDGKHFVQLRKKYAGQKKVPVTFWRDGNVYTTFMDIDPEFTPMS